MDLNTHDALWDKFCEETDLEKAVYKRLFQSQSGKGKANKHEVLTLCTSSE